MKRYTWLIILTIATSIITLLLVSYLDRRNYAATTSSSIFVFEINPKTHFVILENNDLKVYLPNQDFIQEKLSDVQKIELIAKLDAFEDQDTFIPGSKCPVLVLEYTQNKKLNNVFCK